MATNTVRMHHPKPHENHPFTQIKIRILESLMTREGLISWAMPLGSIVLGLLIAMVVNHCNTGHF